VESCSTSIPARGVDGAQVSWQLDEPLLAALPVERVTVDGDGQFRLSVPALHPLRIDVVAPGHEPASLSLATLASQSDADRLPLTLHMHSWQHFGGLRFRAVDENGVAIRQGLLLSSSLFGAREPRVEASAEGGDLIAHPPGLPQVRMPLLWTETLGPSPLQAGTVVLGSRRTLTLEVKEKDGRELPGVLSMKVEMRAMTAPDTEPVYAVWEEWPVARRDFPITLPVVRGCTRIDLFAEGLGIAPASLAIEAEEWPAGATTLQRTMVLASERTLTIIVQERDGRAIPQATVLGEYGWGSSEQPVWRVVDRSGRATLPMPEPQQDPLRQVWVRARGFCRPSSDCRMTRPDRPA
jgi:hypothetical protein